MKILDNLFYIGVDDCELDLFEGQYLLPKGMTYNSYVLLDEEITVLDTVEHHFGDVWMENLAKVLDGKSPKYLVIHHMEPDHSSSLDVFVSKYPEAIIVGNKRTIQMAEQFFPEIDFSKRFLEIKEGDTLNLGKTNLKFYFAPMVHWPEVFMSYDEVNKVLFTADAFGKFGVLKYDDEWTPEARRYYFGIVGKFGKQVQSLLNKVKDLDIQIICSLHGPVLTENISHYVGLYDKWSKYDYEEDGVLVAYTSMYGNTKAAAELAYNELIKAGVKAEIFDLARNNFLDVMPLAFKYSKLLLASPSYNAGILPFMETFINSLTGRNYQKRQVAIIENGSWALSAAKKTKALFEESSEIDFVEPIVSIKSTMSEANKLEIKELVENLSK